MLIEILKNLLEVAAVFFSGLDRDVRIHIVVGGRLNPAGFAWMDGGDGRVAHQKQVVRPAWACSLA